MSEEILSIKYECLHTSCVVFCKRGEISLTESEYASLSSTSEEGIIKSPRDACRMGRRQRFKVLSVVAQSGEDSMEEVDNSSQLIDPVSYLIEEHKMVLEKADRVEEMLVKRDIDGLWVTTQELENILYLHSGIKEEQVLFPALRGLVPFGEGMVVCINEDHREIVSLIYTFRESLRDNSINDKVMGSALVALRSHTRKEDNEFFEFVKGYITDEMKKTIMAGMHKAEKEFVHLEPGERKPDEEKAEERARFHAKFNQSKEYALDTCCC